MHDTRSGDIRLGACFRSSCFVRPLLSTRGHFSLATIRLMAKRSLVGTLALHIVPALLNAQVLPTTRVVDGVILREHKGDAFGRAPKIGISSMPIAVLGGANGDPNYDLTYAHDVVLL